MNVESALRVLLRRWLVVLIGAVLSLVAAVYLYTSTEPTYRAAASILLLLPPGAQDEERDGSPFLYLPNGLNTLARVVGSSANSDAFAEGLVGQGLTSSFEVALERGSPIITVDVEGEDPGDVISTRDGVVTALEVELARVQEGEDVPERQTARARVFAAEESATELSGDRRRGAVMVVGAGGLVTVLAALAVDWILGRSRGRAGRHEPEPNST